MDEITNRSNATNDKIGSGIQGQLGLESKSSTNRNGNNSLKRSLTEDAEDQVTLSKGMIIILDSFLMFLNLLGSIPSYSGVNTI